MSIENTESVETEVIATASETEAKTEVETPEIKDEPKESDKALQAMQRRIDRLTAEKHKIANTYEQRLHDLEAKIKPPTEGEKSVESEVERILADRLKKEQVNQERKSVEENYRNRLNEYIKINPSAMDDIELADVIIPDDVAHEILINERSAELTHYFAKNPDVARKMHNMTDIGKATEFIKALNSLDSLKSEKKNISKAPAPVPDTHGTAPSAQNIESMPIADYIKKRNKEQGIIK
jgi:hypothetical protein